MYAWVKPWARLWERAKNEHSTPREVGWSVAVGAFSGCTPFLGLHMWIALAVATVFRLNRLWAFVGSRVSFLPLFAWITFCEIETAHRARTGRWAPLSPRDAVAHGHELLGDWLMGAAMIGLLVGAAAGALAYVAARRWQRISRHMPGAARRLSSESPPSAPPAPIP